MSPRLTYGLWFEPDRAIRIVHPPRDIVPYVGDGMRSFAGAIFWTGMGLSLKALRTVIQARYRGIVVDPESLSAYGDDGDDNDDDSVGGDAGLDSGLSASSSDGHSSDTGSHITLVDDANAVDAFRQAPTQTYHQNFLIPLDPCLSPLNLN